MGDTVHVTSKADIDATFTAMAHVVDAVAARTSEQQGSGSMPCPKCGGTLRYAFSRGPRFRNGQTFTGRCDTDKCVVFSGH